MKHIPSTAAPTSRAATRPGKRGNAAAAGMPSGQTTTPGPAPGDESIREAAYALYVARGSVNGHELEDWLQAEVQVSQTVGSPAGEPTH